MRKIVLVNVALVLFSFACIPYICAQDNAANQATIDLLTSAPWKVTGDAKGWSRTRVFKKNGTFTTEGEGTEYGRWKISDNMIALTFADKHVDTMTLPLDPKNTRGTSESGEPMTCVLVLPPGKSLPTPTPDALAALKPAAEMTEQEKAAVATQLASAPWKETSTENGGWSKIRVFNRFGAFQTQGETATGFGRWKISGMTVIMEFGDGHTGTITLPLNSKGTSGTDPAEHKVTFTSGN